MYLFESLFIVAVIILFPMFCYSLFASDVNNVNKRTNNVIFDLALFSSLYFMFKGNSDYLGIKVMFLTVPLLIAYLKNKNGTAIIFSICIGLHYIYPLQINPAYVIAEFSLYFIFMYFLKRNKESDTTIISVFSLIKITFMIVELDMLTPHSYDIIKEVLTLPFVFYFMTYLIWYSIKLTEKTMSLHMTMKELEKQKQLQDSLFKITHEIKNPIAVCKGYLDMIDTDNQNQVKRYVPIIKQEIERMLTLLDDFMMLTKINIKVNKMDVSVLLQDICDTVSLISKSDRVEFNSSIMDESLYIDGDYDRLKQVFINLIKNAFEAIPKSVKGYVNLEAKYEKRNLIIEIADNGSGMSKEDLSKIGEAFYTTKKTGTGLGVKFSKEIIDAHHGAIKYKSKLDEGTVVTVKIPIKKSL